MRALLQSREIMFMLSEKKSPHYSLQPQAHVLKPIHNLTWSHTDDSSLVSPDPLKYTHQTHSNIPTSASLFSHVHRCGSFIESGSPKVENSYPKILGPKDPFPRTGPLATKPYLGDVASSKRP